MSIPITDDSGNWILLTSSLTFSIQVVSNTAGELLRSNTMPPNTGSFGYLIVKGNLANEDNLPGSGSNVYGRSWGGRKIPIEFRLD